MRSNGLFCPPLCALEAEADSGQDSTAGNGELKHFGLIGGPLDLVLFVTTQKVEDTITALDCATQLANSQAMAGSKLHRFRVDSTLIEVDLTEMSQAVTGCHRLPAAAK